MSDIKLKSTGWKTFGHDSVVQSLDHAFQNNRLAHAYLFTGPAQTGKLTLAIDLACLVNYKPSGEIFEQASVNDFGESQSTDRIRTGKHGDVKIINENTIIIKKNPEGQNEEPNGVHIRLGHIRDLRHFANLKPFEGNMSVFIMDGAEKMTSEASNSLLKTLEEPPETVLIILLAPSVDVLPETITSRCQHFRIAPVSEKKIREELLKSYDTDIDTSKRVARLSRGKPGWAIDALTDPALIEIRIQMTQRVISIVDGNLEQRFQYAKNLSGRFRKSRKSVLMELYHWAEFWRDVAMVKTGLNQNVINEDSLKSITLCAENISENEIALAASAARYAYDAIVANTNPQLTIEVMMLNTPYLTSVKSI